MHDQKGFSTLELMVVLFMSSILLSLAVSSLSELNDPLRNGTAQLHGFFKQVRTRAVSTTSAYIVEPVSPGKVVTKYGTSCSDPSPTTESLLILELPKTVSLTSTTWSVCFTSRGLADQSLNVGIQDTEGSGETIEIFMGGAVRVL